MCVNSPQDFFPSEEGAVLKRRERERVTKGGSLPLHQSAANHSTPPALLLEDSDDLSASLLRKSLIFAG